jgi:hypothetical protein
MNEESGPAASAGPNRCDRETCPHFTCRLNAAEPLKIAPQPLGKGLSWDREALTMTARAPLPHRANSDELTRAERIWLVVASLLIFGLVWVWAEHWTQTPESEESAVTVPEESETPSAEASPLR